MSPEAGSNDFSHRSASATAGRAVSAPVSASPAGSPRPSAAGSWPRTLPAEGARWPSACPRCLARHPLIPPLIPSVRHRDPRPDRGRRHPASPRAVDQPHHARLHRRHRCRRPDRAARGGRPLARGHRPRPRPSRSRRRGRHHRAAHLHPGADHRALRAHRPQGHGARARSRRRRLRHQALGRRRAGGPPARGRPGATAVAPDGQADEPIRPDHIWVLRPQGDQLPSRLPGTASPPGWNGTRHVRAV